MVGLAFAAAALAGVLVVELLLFRYASSGGVSTRATDGANESPNAGGGVVSRSGVAAGSAVGDAVDCRHCGAANADAPTIVFCRSCTNRLR